MGPKGNTHTGPGPDQFPPRSGNQFEPRVQMKLTRLSVQNMGQAPLIFHPFLNPKGTRFPHVFWRNSPAKLHPIPRQKRGHFRDKYSPKPLGQSADVGGGSPPMRHQSRTPRPDPWRALPLTFRAQCHSGNSHCSKIIKNRPTELSTARPPTRLSIPV